MNNMDAQKALERSYVSSLENKEYDEAGNLIKEFKNDDFIGE